MPSLPYSKLLPLHIYVYDRNHTDVICFYAYTCDRNVICFIFHSRMKYIKKTSPLGQTYKKKMNASSLNGPWPYPRECMKISTQLAGRARVWEKVWDLAHHIVNHYWSCAILGIYTGHTLYRVCSDPQGISKLLLISTFCSAVRHLRISLKGGVMRGRWTTYNGAEMIPAPSCQASYLETSHGPRTTPLPQNKGMQAYNIQ